MGKERLDVILVNKQLFESREKAKRAIMAGTVFVDGERVDKAGFLCDPDSSITVKHNPIPYVSRGGLKLEKALSVFSIKLEGLTCVDVGASTGGFTDVMLKTAPERFILWMWDMASSPGPSATTRGLSAWREPISVMLNPRISVSLWILDRWMFPSSP